MSERAGEATDATAGTGGATQAAVEALLARHDPLRLIALGAPPDEYAPEAEALLPALPGADSPAALHRLVHETFVRYFDWDLAGPPEAYRGITEDLWALWHRTGPAEPGAGTQIEEAGKDLSGGSDG